MSGFDVRDAGFEELHSLLAAVRRRWLTLIAARTAARALSVAAVPLLAALAIDLVAAPGAGASIVLGVLAVLASLSVAAAVVWRSRRRPDDRQLARFIEEQVADRPEILPLADTVVSAVDAASADEPSAFRHLVIGNAVVRLRQIAPSTVVLPGVLNRAMLESAGGVALFVAAAFVARVPLERAFDGARLAFFPSSVSVQVAPGNTRVVAGRPLRIRASIRGGTTALQRLTPTLTVSAANQQRTVAMTRKGGEFEFALESVDRSFRYRVSAGAAASDEYTVTALFAPRVQRIDARYVYPSFSGRAPRDERGAGDMYAPEGTRVHVRVHTDKAAASGELAFGHAAAAVLRPTSDRILEGDIVLSAEDSYRIRLADADGLRSDDDTEYFIRIVDDRPPDVRILRPVGDQPITALEEVAIEARADDDYGIAQFDLVYSVAGHREHVVPFARVSGSEVEKVGALLLAAEDLHVRPGDVITYYARARDVARGKPSTEAKSDIFFLEVKPFNEEFVSSQSQALAGASGTQIDALIAAQKEIINATWNLERRSFAGRSTADLDAVARAQSQLKQRTEKVAGPGVRRRWGTSPEDIQTPSSAQRERQESGDPVAAAVESMGRALQQLQAQRTKDAIPHELSALQGLLQAQAELRRREVTQQAGSGGGSGRQGQDLTALFDKELQRQQRTNYETRPHLEEQPEQRNGDGAAERVRELAKRQENLSRRQRELAIAPVSDEERKRQLERLTREQNELRDEVERLAREISRQPATGGQQERGENGQAGSPQAEGQSAGSAAMRGASEQMRAAAGDLRREDPEAAAADGQRAAEQLRRMEQQMRAGSAGARERAVGELQLEAQQIADAQRRIATGVDRLDPSASARDADTRRRLASQKEQLADRVDGLQRAARQFAKEQPNGQGAPAAVDAAREIEQRLLGDEMRNTARALRGEAGASGGANERNRRAAEQQIARAMDRVVDKLGGKSGADSNRLAGELDRTRQIRERLNDLERRIRETEATARDAAARAAEHTKPGNKGAQGKGTSAPDNELQQLRDEYARELQRARQSFAPNGQGEQRSGRGASTPEQEEFSRSAPGTEAFKNDFSRWENLRKDVDLALEKYEAAASARVTQKQGKDRLSGGGSERVPEAYRETIARYYESLARAKK